MSIRSFVSCIAVVFFAGAVNADPSVQTDTAQSASGGWFDRAFNTHLSEYQSYKDCISYSADYFKLSRELMVAVLMTERGYSAKVKQNNDGTFDLGIYQINQVRLPELKQFNIDAVTLATDQCINAFMAAYILHNEINDAENYWEGVGNYHYGIWGKYPANHFRYIDKVYRNWLKLAEAQ